MNKEDPPAGWYRDGTGRTRWWDGKQWTVPNHLFPEAPAASQDADSEPMREPVATADEAQTGSNPQSRDKPGKAAKADKPSRPWHRRKH